MGKIAVVFPGQGSQSLGMGKDFYEQFSKAKAIIDSADTLLGFNLKDLLFNGPVETLGMTENTQPAILCVSIAILEVLKEKGLVFQAAAGHSLGEYSAYTAAGKIQFQDALKLVRERGLLMSNADPEKKGGMAAVMRMDDQVLVDICAKYSEVVPANFNCPGQIVISGNKEQLALVYQEIDAAKGKAMPLNVSGPFHSPLMKKAAEEFKKTLSGIEFKKSLIPVYANVSASPVEEGKEKESLTAQISSSVRWTETIQNMIKDGFDTFIEIGNGKVLQGLIKKIDKTVKIYGVEKPEDIEKLDILK
ncbi:MAG TPA: [acyl-carrier-protein] S-malonyltransferase [Spirochaetia bacterium]|nr:MAG: [acyl-carrier-protein] S-malonyltransferase [Spirochaetes bacterium GWB1_36_13]HCL57827.1 [acyl-carrier-protein] S-malonyltransferase [Spirochaetia bacterium]